MEMLYFGDDGIILLAHRLLIVAADGGCHEEPMDK